MSIFGFTEVSEVNFREPNPDAKPKRSTKKAEPAEPVTPPIEYGICHDSGLRMFAGTVDDVEEVRKAIASRLRQMLRDEPDTDGVMRGLSLSETDYFVVSTKALLELQESIEKDAIKSLEKRMKQHPLAGWVAENPGVGLKQAARLISAIGDPYWHVLQQRPRRLSELWAYSGYHTVPGVPDENKPDEPVMNVAARRRKGVKSNWSSEAKTRAYLVAESCIKQIGGENRKRSPFRDVYEKRRAYTKDLHPEWSDGHSHNDAIRITAKEILRSLWLAAREVHEEQNKKDHPNG